MIAVIAIGVVTLVSFYPWLLAVFAVLALFLSLCGKLRRWLWLRRRGYFVDLGKSGASLYVEIREGGEVGVDLPSCWPEPGRYHLTIPTREEWQHSAPDWAALRRDEIFRRVKQFFGSRDITCPEDWEATEEG